MTATGIHQTDLCCSYFGTPIEVRAETSSLIFEPPATDFVTATVKFASGVRGVLTLLSCVPYYGRITVFGDKGWIEVVTEGNVDQGKPTIVTVCKGTNAPREVTTFQSDRYGDARTSRPGLRQSRARSPIASRRSSFSTTSRFSNPS